MSRGEIAASRAARWLPAFALASLVVWVALLVTGGFSWRIGSWQITAHQSWPALAAAVAASAASLHPAIRRRLPSVLASWWTGFDRHARRAALITAIVTFVFGIQYGSFVAGGADSYGYVSQAHLWAKGALRTYQPIAHQVSWPESDWTFTPLGYRPGRRSGYIVPTYSPGLPLLMAAAFKVAGERAMFAVVPALGAVAVWLTFVIGCRVDRPATGAIAAVLLATSPIFLYQIVQAMSDVPVTMWWTAAIAAALRRDMTGAALAGLAASAAILTRPNLLPVAIPLGLYFLLADMRRVRWTRRAAASSLFGVTLLPGILVIARVNQMLYGSPLESGYGSVSQIYDTVNLLPNTRQYSQWLFSSQTWFITAAAIGPVILWRRRRSPDHTPPRGSFADSMLFASFAAVLFACYAFYLVFNDWWYIRFLMPALPIALVLATLAAIDLVSRLPQWSRTPVVVLLTALLASTYVAKADAYRTFTFARDDRHYVDAADYVSKALPPRAVLLAVQESGSLRYYAGRLTLRWDMIERSKLDTTLEELRQKGYPPYFVLETWEETDFRERFAGHSPLATLDWPPLADIGLNIRVRIYDPAARARYLAGEAVQTERIVTPER